MATERRVHLEYEVDGFKTAECGAKTVSLTPRRADVTCTRCLSAIGPSWWRLQLERRPGEWIDTPTVKKTIQRPRPLKFDTSGRATRWMNVGGIEDWG